jgi:hypothetical protein
MVLKTELVFQACWELHGTHSVTGAAHPLQTDGTYGNQTLNVQNHRLEGLYA